MFMGPEIVMFAIPFVLYIIPMLIGSVILHLLFKVKTNRYIIISGCLPFLSWCGLFPSQATLSNFLVNPVILSFCMLLVQLIYHIVNKKVVLENNTIHYAFLGLSLVTLVAFLLFMPPLPLPE